SKQCAEHIIGRFSASPPARRRGSKRCTAQSVRGSDQSPPARRRGSKPAACGLGLPATTVASRAEAWIETDTLRKERVEYRVASRAEAWIETASCRLSVSHPDVASRAEAWIETPKAHLMYRSRNGRLPRGGVDRNDDGHPVEQDANCRL